MQHDLGGQAGLKSPECMGAFAIKAEGVVELGIDGLDYVAYPREPATQSLWPGTRTMTFGRADHARAVVLLPGPGRCRPLKAFIDHLGSLGWRPCPTPWGLWSVAEGKKRLRQGLIRRAGQAKAPARDHTLWGDGEEQGQPLVPPQPIAPADMGQPREPAEPSALGITGGDARAVPRFVWTLVRGQELDDMQATQDKRRLLAAQLAVPLRPRGQAGASAAQVPRCIAIQAACTAKPRPRSTERSRENRTPPERRLGTGLRFDRQRGGTAIVNHDIKRCEKGVDIDHSKCSLSWGG